MSEFETSNNEAAALTRETIQSIGAGLIGWGTLVTRAACVAPAPEIREVMLGARKELIAGIDAAKALVEIEGDAS